jgi:hypothetical protein
MDGANIGMIQRRGGLGFVNEAFLFIFIRAEMWWEKFKHDEAIELEVLGFIDHAHASAAELFEDFVVGNAFAEHNDPRRRTTSVPGIPVQRSPARRIPIHAIDNSLYAKSKLKFCKK